MCESCDSGEIQDTCHVLDRCKAHDEARIQLHAETRIALKLGANAQVETSHLLALHPQKCMSMRMLNAIEKYMIDSDLLNEGESEEEEG